MPGDGAGASFRSSLSPTHPLCVSLWGFVPVQGRAEEKNHGPHPPAPPGTLEATICVPGPDPVPSELYDWVL